MPIIDLQRRIAEAGRIRIGSQVPTGDQGKTRPVKLETFRLTSPDKLRIEQAAAMWGGKPQQWQAPAGPQWEVFTEASSLDVIVPPADMSFSQSYELWSAGGCQRRCDGRWNSVAEGDCICDPDNRECDIHTRLSVMLRDLPGLGVWRVDTQGYYAAVELQGAVQVIEMAAGRGQLLPARLLLVQRQVKRPGPDGKPQTRKFAVPVLDIEVTPGQLLARPHAMASESGRLPSEMPEARAALNAAIAKVDAAIDGSSALSESPAAAPQRHLTPVPDSVQHRPAGSVADQMKASTEPQDRKRRKNSAAPVPPTGVEPRTAAQAQADIEAAGQTGAIRQHLPGPTSDPLPDGDAAADTVTGNGREPELQPGSVTPQQIRSLHARLTELGFNSRTERETLLQLTETLAGRELTGPNQGIGGVPRTTKNLSYAEAVIVLNRLGACADQAAVWELVEGIEHYKPDA